jgi:hypothetical protein
LATKNLHVSFLGDISVSVDDLLNDKDIQEELKKTRRAMYSTNPTLSFMSKVDPEFTVGKTTLKSALDSLVKYSELKGLYEQSNKTDPITVRDALNSMMQKKDPNFLSYFSQDREDQATSFKVE